MRVEGFYGKAKVVPLAKVWIDIGDFRFQKRVAELESCPDGMLLDADVQTCILDALLDFERSTRTPKIYVVTRARSRQLVLGE